ncbi:MAG: 5-oxoprolinase subunit PxpB [Bryobacteraceae bacterium]
MATFQCASDQTLLVYFESQPSLHAHHQVVKLTRLLQAEPIPGIRNLHPAYGSVLVKFNPLERTHHELEAILASYLDRIENLPLPEPRHVEIPICYGGDFGPDLEDVAHLHNLTPAQVVELHSSATYFVSFLGFVPGFAYLSGLPEVLATPRLDRPRRKVPAGTLGMGGTHTGIYPFSTPGGWRLIGRTPVQMFQPDRADMSRLSIGDRVHFTPISEEQFSARGWDQ